MATAERMNYDDFDLICCAADASKPLSAAELSASLRGVNLEPRGLIALQRLIRQGYIESVAEDQYRITGEGRKALA
ncbi:hypothetical protein [Planctomyces sp. SH-PL14]|uniref:hypothetical protein n=1 Tax=Planctomyces sp. SH-PL14 TaxID=1632864 RepID=UPI00078D24ED|nr:hypothetical protein [Planctomyces sp. SH-PL14]AMV19617.1 hypothetical protein VT03_17105 [Planctomyces sp. SH-PL14]